jgi:hypothetical protein
LFHVAIGEICSRCVIGELDDTIAEGSRRFLAEIRCIFFTNDLVFRESVGQHMAKETLGSIIRHSYW